MVQKGHPGLKRRWSWLASLQRYMELGEGVFREEEVNSRQREEIVQRLDVSQVWIRNCKTPWNINGW